MTDDTNQPPEEPTEGHEAPAEEPAPLSPLEQAAAEAAAGGPEAPDEVPVPGEPPVPDQPTMPAPPEMPAETEAPADTEAPALLADRYEIGQLTARTAMLETHLGTDRVQGTTVDIKFLSSQLAQDVNFADRFESEARRAMAIDHPNAVKVLDAGASPDGRRYVILEHVEGRTLQEVLKSEGPLEAERAATIASGMCQALQAAHQLDIFHGDINPSVVVLPQEGPVKVSEFGVARVESPQTVAQTRAIMGTAAYLSPEQAQGETADGRADIYATGIVLYEMIAGAPPFTADSPVALAYMHVRDTPKPLKDLKPETPERIADAVMKALAKKPAERFKDPAAFSAALAPIPAGTASQEAAGSADLAPATMVFGSGKGGGGGLTNRTKLIIGLVAAALAFAALYAVLLMPRNVRVPTVINMEQARAEQTLIDAGLKVKVLEQASNEVPAGFVFGQAPAAAQVVRKGTTVLITVAKAPANITVPNVVGLSQADAEAAIEQAGLTVGTVGQEASDTAPAGSVLSQDPAAGTVLAAPTPINLTVAQMAGPAIVPNLTCNTPDRAALVLSETGLQMTVVGVETDPDFTNICPMDGKPRITQSNPAAGTEVADGAIIQVWTTVPLASTAPSPPPGSPFPSPVNPSATGSPLP